jgi:hypothetical protein
MMAESMRPSRQAILLFFGLLFIYNLNLRQVSSHDTYASRFVPISILRDGDLILDEFVPETIKQQAGDQFFSDYFHYTRGHFYDSHPPIGPLLALPVYALPAWIGIPARAELVANLFSKLAASIMAALSALAVFAASRRLLRATKASLDDHQRTREMSVALMAALTYGLATSVWSTASLAMWTHTPAVMAYAIALWALMSQRPGFAGAAVAAAVVARQATAPAAALLGVYLAHRAWYKASDNGWSSETARASRADLYRFCAASVVIGLTGLLYNYWMFGNAVGGAPLRTAYWVKELGAAGMFSGSFAVGLPGLTISPNRGILIFCPAVLIAVAGAITAWRMNGRSDAVLLARYASIAALGILLIYSKFIAWWGGHGFGPRYLTDAMPFLGPLFALGLMPLVERTSGLRLRQTAAIVLLCYSVFIQAVGAFCWPSRWTLDDNPPYRFRLWDWRNTEIATCIREGPKVDPAARQLINRLGL